MPTIKEIKECLSTIDRLDHPLFEELILDGRAGVQAAISKRKRELQKQVDEDLRSRARPFGWPCRRSSRHSA